MNKDKISSKGDRYSESIQYVKNGYHYHVGKII